MMYPPVLNAGSRSIKVGSKPNRSNQKANVGPATPAPHTKT